MSYLPCLCLFAYSGVQHKYCVFVLFVLVLCLVHTMLPLSLDCLFLIAPSVFSNIYLPYVVSFSGLSIYDCSFDIL